jgi:OmpA-OmpF porin, OOP family
MRAVTAVAVVTAAVLGALVPLTAAAGVTIGANVGSARVNEGDFEGSDTGWKAHIGSSYREIIGGEVGFVNFGKLGGDGPDAQAWAPALTIGVPVGLANLYAKGGVAFAEVEGSSLREEYSSEDPFYGVGLRIGQQQGLAFRAEYERYEFEQEDVDMAQAGLELRF